MDDAVGPRERRGGYGDQSRQNDIANQLAIDHSKLLIHSHAGFSRALERWTRRTAGQFPWFRTRNNATLAVRGLDG